MSELHIPEEALLEAKIQKLAVVIREVKEEVARVQFELNTKIIELVLKLQPSTSPKVREQCSAAVKEGIAIVDVAVVDCTNLFEHAMDVVTTLQEDPTLYILSTEICAPAVVRRSKMKIRSMATGQHLAKLQEAKKLLTQVEEAQKKEAVLKAQLGPWLDEAYQVSTNI